MSKNHNKRCLVFFLPLLAFVLCLSLSSRNSFAEGTSPDKQKPVAPEFYLDDRKMEPADIVSYFVHATIGRLNSETYVGGTAPVAWHYSKTTLDTSAGYKDKYPWLYEFMYREKGMPRFYAINKWAQPVRIAFGFPNDLKPYVSSKAEKTDPDVKAKLPEANLEKGLSETLKHEVFVWAEEEILSSIPEMKDVTGLDISFLKDEPVAAPIENLGNLRIILHRERADKEGTSAIRFSGRGVHNSYFRKYLDVSYLQTAVRFTPGTMKQVDGYILPNANNTIGMTFCYIWDGHPKDVFQKFVRECLFRSLGMPGEVYHENLSILSFWTDADKYKPMWEKLGYLDNTGEKPDGYPFAQNPSSFEREELEAKDLAEQKKAEALEEEKLRAEESADPPKKLSAMESYLMRLLYSKDIKAGMGEMDVHRQIVK